MYIVAFWDQDLVKGERDGRRREDGRAGERMGWWM